MLAAIGAALLTVLGAIGRGIVAAFGALANLVSRSRVALVVCIVALVLVCAGGIDAFANWGRAYAGVYVGDVAVGGMNASQIKEALESEYGARLNDTTVIIFASEDSRSYLNDAIAQAEDRAQAEQLSVDEARLNNQLWTTSSSELGGSIDYDDLAQQAIEIGRGNGGIFARLHAQIFGDVVPASLTFSDGEVEHLAQSIDETLGDARIDADISIYNGWAAANDGHDGMMVNRDALRSTIASLILGNDDDNTFVASVEDAPSRTTYEQAADLATRINSAISDGAAFTYQDATWSLDSATLGDWIETSIQNNDGSWVIQPFIDTAVAKPQIMQGILNSANIDPVAVSFTKDDSGTVSVSTSSDKTAPAVGEAADSLNTALFGSEGKATVSSDAALAIAVGDESVSAIMTLDEAVSAGLVAVVGTYTTEYSTYTGTEARNHNIHLAADLINNSIVKANGGEWDFNDVAGDCNEERGFQAAGTIIDGQYVDNIGGGICQVATTVFNAVYESGLDIIERHNHSLYLSSYPDGRDAAVSYPDLTLVWGDESESDVLLTTSYTESSLTVTLYSAPLSYTVTSEVGSWSEGEKYGTIEKEDDSLAAGQSYVKTAGQDGKSITVIRYVHDANGNIVKTNYFASTYDALDEVVVKGPDADDDDSDS